MSEDAPAENAEHTQTSMFLPFCLSLLVDPVVWKDVSAEEFDNDPVLEVCLFRAKIVVYLLN